MEINLKHNVAIENEQVKREERGTSDLCTLVLRKENSKEEKFMKGTKLASSVRDTVWF